MLHELVAGHVQTLLAELRDADPEGGGLPRYVERELAAYLRCGILAGGFARVRCQSCRDERVFTVPKPLRLVLARDPAWTSWISGLVVRAIGAWQRRVARKRGIRSPLTGAVTFVERFGGQVNLNVNFHVVVPDGVFVSDDEGLRFEMLPVPTNASVLAILDRIGVAAGMGNEHTGRRCCCFVLVYSAWAWRRARGHILLNTGTVAAVVGYALIFFAPGQRG